jgi:ribosomal protein S18 acetylase RimI-like enzyme
MDEAVITIRPAILADAAEIARVYIESWHDTYAAILPKRLLCAMTPRGQTARWQAALRARTRERVLVAQRGRKLAGMTSFGPSRDGDLGFDSEIYTLYVDPAYFGCGIGRALLRAAFTSLEAKGFSSCIIWAHAKNNARFFYEAMGGTLVAERMARMMGDSVPEAAFGWRKLALAEREHHE